MPFKQDYAFVWAPPSGSSGTRLVFGLSEDGLCFELYIDQASLKMANAMMMMMMMMMMMLMLMMMMMMMMMMMLLMMMSKEVARSKAFCPLMFDWWP